MESRNLTIMMTDIKGFTVRTSTMSRDQIETLLHDHEQLLSPIFVEFDGTVVKTIGDAFLVTFASATKAIEAGQKIQRTLSAHNARAKEDQKLLVRVVLNAGEVNIREGDVFGEPVNITARVEGVAEASHVTFTDAVRLLLNQDAVPFEELGDFELKGIPKPVSLFRMIPDWAVDPSSEAKEEGKGGAKGGKVQSGDGSASSQQEQGAQSEDPRLKTQPGVGANMDGGGNYALPVIVLLLIAIAAGAYFMTPTNPLVACQALASESKYEDALKAVEKVLAAAPANKEAATLRRQYGLALIDKSVKEEKWFDAFSYAEYLLKLDNKDEEAKKRAIDIAAKGVAASIASSEFEKGFSIVERLKKLMPDLDKLKTFRATVDMAALRKVYEQAMIARVKGPSAALKVFREGKFSKIIKELRRMGHRAPELDFFEARYLMTQVSALPPSTWLTASSYGRPDAKKAIDLYSTALEKDKSLREKREVADDLISLLKLYDPTQDRNETGPLLRRTIASYHAEWIVEKLLAVAVQPANPADGDNAHEASYRLRHNVRLILESAGMQSRADKDRFARLDFEWFRKHQKNDSLLRDRMGKLAAEISFSKSKPLKAEFVDLLRKLRDLGGLGWAELYHQHIASAGTLTEKDETYLLVTKLDYYIQSLFQNYTAKRNEWAVNSIKTTIPECAKIKEEKNKKELLSFFVSYRMQLEEKLKEALPILDETVKKLKGE